jgi:acetyl-CoA carboxylase carboxyl transferase subunit beta
VNWINNVVRPKISGLLSTTKRDVPDNLWVKCPETGQMVFYKDLEANQFVVPGSNYHMRMEAGQRLTHLFDNGEYKVVAVPTVTQDPLKFRDGRKYTDRLKDAKATTKLEDAVLVGEGTLEGRQVVAAVQDFRFMAGSLGMAAGEALITGMLRAVDLKTPFILFAASGGARMQEGILSLMQMPRVTIAVQRLRENRLPYIVVLTDPTTGGVTASYAMLGDVHIAEPGALICFAGPRVIQQTIREQLPDGFQRSEYLLSHGMVDMVVHRHQIRETLTKLCSILMTGAGNAKTKDARKGNGRHYVNGAGVDGKVIETAARDSGGVMEAEAVPPSQRFEPGRGEKGKRDGDPASQPSNPKDAPRGV